MTGFQPYTILHRQISEIGSDVLTETNAYFVFWWKKIPLGHIWYEPGEPASPNTGPSPALPQEFVSRIAAALEPALTAYLENAPDTWRSWLSKGDYPRLGRFLDEYMSGLPESPFPDQRPPVPALSASPHTTALPANLSVVVCTRNRPLAIEQCIKALLGSADKDFELLVVDNAPDNEQTRDVILRFPTVRYIRENRKGLDIARNTGARNASHSLIAYTDDDVLVDTDWTSHIKNAFRDPMTMALTGLVIPDRLQTHSQYIFEKYWGFNKGYAPKTFDHRYFMQHLGTGVPAWDIGAGANMAFRREVFDLAGWFDERLDVGAAGCSGDSEFWYRILAEGWNCVYDPAIFVYHQHRQSEKELRRQLYAYMRGQVCSLLIQYERYGHRGNLVRLYRGLPRYYYQRTKSWWRNQARELLRKRGSGKKPDQHGMLPAEWKGCLSGWLYYKRHRNEPAYREETPLPLPALPFIPLSPEQAPSAPVQAAPLVSVIIPCYNHAHYLPQAIASIRAQTYPHWEIIVVDDGSTDHTAALCRSYPGIRYTRAERVGLSAARNIGVQCSSGRFLVFLDADDFLYPQAFETNLRYFRLYPQIAFASGAHDRIDREGRLLPVKDAMEKTSDHYWSLLHGNYIAMEATVMYRRELFFRFHFDPRLKACEDYDLNLAITRDFPAYGHTIKIAAYRIHDQNMSHNGRLMLRSVLTVMDRQKKRLKTKAEQDAFREGIRNWEKYYL